MRIAALALGAALVATAARADDTPQQQPPITSQIYEAPGQDAETLTHRALACIPQTVKPIYRDEQTIISSDAQAGVVVANNGFLGGMFGDRPLRSTMTFEAKPGRFRFVYSDIQMLLGGWRPMKTDDHEVTQLRAISDKVAACVQAQADW